MTEIQTAQGADEVEPAGDPVAEDVAPEVAARALEGTVEAILFSSEIPLNAKRLAEVPATARHGDTAPPPLASTAAATPAAKPGAKSDATASESGADGGDEALLN